MNILSRIFLILFLIVLSKNLNAQVSEISFKLYGGMNYYTETYKVSLKESYVEINKSGQVTKNSFKVTMSELIGLEKALRDLNYYDIRTEPLDINDGVTRKITIVYSGIEFSTASDTGQKIQERYSQTFKDCIELIISFCTARV